jgi:hypothetical protein
MASQLSASAHLAQFGFTTKQANDWIVANIGSPKTIIDVCQQVGITRAMLSEITGYGVDLITSFFSLYNLDATKLDSTQIANPKTDVDLFSLTHNFPNTLAVDVGQGAFNIILDFDKSKTTVNLNGTKLTVYSLSDTVINFSSDDAITIKNLSKSTAYPMIIQASKSDVVIYGFSEMQLNTLGQPAGATVTLVGVNPGNSFTYLGLQEVGRFNSLSVGDITII